MSNVKRAGTLEKDAYERIKDEIFTGLYPPGTMLKENKLSEHLNISRTPIRTALQQLLFEKIVSEDSTGHIFVAKPTRSEVQEITEMRLALEPIALMNPDGLHKEIITDLESLTNEQSKINSNDMHGLIKFSKLDSDFHSKLSEFSNNSLLKESIKTFNSMMMRCNILSGTLAINIPEAIEEHRNIIDYLKKEKYEFARLALSQHLNRVNERMFSE